MKLILTGWLTVGLALLWDKFLCYIGLPERVRIGVLIPIGEEFLKFGIAYLANLSPLLLYSIFGFGEGLYEMFHSQKRFDLGLLAAGTLTHTLFGLVFLLEISAWICFALALTIHLLWNNVILDLQNGCKGRSD